MQRIFEKNQRFTQKSGAAAKYISHEVDTSLVKTTVVQIVVTDATGDFQYKLSAQTTIDGQNWHDAGDILTTGQTETAMGSKGDYSFLGSKARFVLEVSAQTPTTNVTESALIEGFWVGKPF